MRPFMFEVDFDVDPVAEAAKKKAAREEARRAEEEANAPPPPPTFSEEELEAARQEGYAAGEEAGRSEAYASIEQMSAMTTETIAQQMAHMADTHRKAMQSVQDGAIRIAVAIAKRLVPSLAEDAKMKEVEDVARETLTLVRDESRVIVHVSDTMIETVEPTVMDVARQVGFDGTVRVIGDTSLTEGDCRIEWSGGGAERVQAKVWEEIDRAIDRYLRKLDDEDVTVEDEAPQVSPPDADQDTAIEMDAVGGEDPAAAPTQ